MKINAGGVLKGFIAFIYFAEVRAHNILSFMMLCHIPQAGPINSNFSEQYNVAYCVQKYCALKAHQQINKKSSTAVRKTFPPLEIPKINYFF